LSNVDQTDTSCAQQIYIPYLSTKAD